MMLAGLSLMRGGRVEGGRKGEGGWGGACRSMRALTLIWL